jgi:hypothetical protein
MDAILKPETMAGSPDADARVAGSVPQSCAWFFVLWRPLFRKPMKEDHNVQ